MLCFVAVIAMTHGARAQAPAPVEPVNAPFLERRVPDELAAEGVVLSRRNLGLQVEQVADKWLVSLLDLTTGRVAASTRVDALPGDREAAVAAMTHVAAELAAQIVGHGEAPVVVPPPATPAPSPSAGDDRAEQRELAELKYRRRAIRFGEALAISANGTTTSVSRAWTIHQGDLDEELKPVDFYQAMGRPDLAAQYTSRRHHAIGGFIVSGVGVLAELSVLITSHDKDTSFSIATLVVANLAIFGGAFYGIHYSNNLHPIEENDAKAMADAYNQRLRRELGLPVVTRRPLLHDMTVTPYLASNQSGLAMTARF